MIGLLGLWLVSIVLSSAALLIMAGLILARSVSNRRKAVRESERGRWIPVLLGAGPTNEQAAEAERAPDLLTDLSVEFIQLVRGEDKQVFVSNAQRLGVGHALRRRLKRGSPRVRVTAAEALADFADDRSVVALEQALEDRNADVRLAAALSLAAVDRAPPASELVRKLRLGTAEHSMLAVALFEEIARTRGEEIKALIEDPGSPPPVKAAAIEALAGTGNYSLVPLIADLALKAPPESHELPRYIRALGAFGHPAGAGAIKAALASPAWWVRAAGAEAAGRVALLETALRLAALLDDADWWVRFRAGEALARFDETGRQLLGEVARHGSERARRAARLTLAERGLPL